MTQSLSDITVIPLGQGVVMIEVLTIALILWALALAGLWWLGTDDTDEE